MNILSAMSKIAGRLALLDAMNKCNLKINKAVIIGFGAVGRSAFYEALKNNLNTFVFITNDNQKNEIESAGGKTIYLDKNIRLEEQQKIILNEIENAQIVITSARKSNQLAPLLIPKNTLDSMQQGSVIVDMALSEGGNVEGSEHDASHILGNGIIVTNVSGYPKAMPREASILWSKASLHFVLK
jgi:NAD/NADP transhydrogenase alpha subunit